MKIYANEKFKELKQEIKLYNKENRDIYEADILIGNPKELFSSPEKFTNLKFVQLLSSGYDGLNLEILNKNKVVVANARGLYSDDIAEYCLAYILYEYNNVALYLEKQSNKEWFKDVKSRSLYNNKVLILGTGSIGQSISKRLHAFDVHVDGLNSNGRRVTGFSRTFSFETVKSELSSYDIVISSLPANKHTNGIIDKDFFLSMRSDAIFMNVGRGDVVNEGDLLSILDNHLSKVILDVFINEPLESDSLFYSHPKVILTPHSSASSSDSDANATKMVQENLDCFLNGEEIKNKISR